MPSLLRMTTKFQWSWASKNRSQTIYHDALYKEKSKLSRYCLDSKVKKKAVFSLYNQEQLFYLLGLDCRGMIRRDH